jgi:hypothetical protein
MYAGSEPSVVIFSSGYSNACEDDNECMHEINAGVCTKCRCVVSSYDSGGEWNATGFPRAPDRGSYSGIRKTFVEKANLTHFEDSTVARVAALYEKTIKNRSPTGKKPVGVLRCNRRDGVIAACLERVLHDQHITKPARYFIELFGVSAKDFSDGQTMVAMATKNAITPKIHELVRTYAQQLGLSPSDVSKSEAFALALHKADRAFNTSAPNSVAAAFLFSFIENTPRVSKTIPGFSKETFGTRVQISPATIGNLCAVVNSLLG